jgi:hypothetical protein
MSPIHGPSPRNLALGRQCLHPQRLHARNNGRNRGEGSDGERKPVLLFPSKQDLLFFCQDESLGRLIDEASTITTSKQHADEQLRAMIVFHVRTILEELPGSSAHTDFRSLSGPLLRKVIKKRDRYEQAYRFVIERGIKQGVFRKCNVKTATWAVLGALN